jgi:hypothetical protein
MYSVLSAIGKTVHGYMENIDSNGSNSCSAGTAGAVTTTFTASQGQYAQKHNPFPFFTAGTTNKVPTSAWGPFPPSDSNSGSNSHWAQTYSWPNVSFITPDEPHDMHNWSTSTVAQQEQQGDKWMQFYLPDIITYCQNNRGLLIITMDEDSNGGTNQVPTVLIGYDVPANQTVGNSYNHDNFLKLIVNNFGASSSALGNAATAAVPTVPQIAGSASASELAPPTIGSPGPDTTIGCEDTPVFTPPSAADGCSQVSIIETSDTTVILGSDTTIYQRCWQAVDSCGNTSDTVCQTITKTCGGTPSH